MPCGPRALSLDLGFRRHGIIGRWRVGDGDFGAVSDVAERDCPERQTLIGAAANPPNSVARVTL